MKNRILLLTLLGVLLMGASAMPAMAEGGGPPPKTAQSAPPVWSILLHWIAGR